MAKSALVAGLSHALPEHITLCVGRVIGTLPPRDFHRTMFETITVLLLLSYWRERPSDARPDPVHEQH
jgi:hypothetical protein